MQKFFSKFQTAKPTPQWALEKIREAKEQKLNALDLSVRTYEDKGKLTKLPDELFELSELTSLNLSRNQLITLPESITRLQNLRYLDLNTNQLSTLPESIGQLQNLTRLYLRGNRLSTLPESIGQLQNLTDLLLYGNQLSTLPESITQLQNLDYLDLRGNGLSTLSASITRLQNLTFLDLSDNGLSTLPESITRLQNLTSLYLSGNQISTLPESITQLQNLTFLALSDNRLSTLPESITQLQNLTSLYLGGNQFSTLPESISQLQNLTFLDLSDNGLDTLPESITRLQNLTSLDLSDNQISTLPESITQLQNLTSLELSRNQLSTLPESITRLQNLQRLILWDNPLISPPIEIAIQGIEAIREYFRQLDQEGVDYLYEAKLLILGEGGAGKTTFANKILDSNYALKEEETTKGLNVLKWALPMEGNRQFKVNIWDFGGQEIYHATHQFFLTRRSLYTLIADTRKEDTDFYYWLNAAELLSEGSPLLIIKNEKQDRLREINERQLRWQFDGLKEVLATNRGLEEVKREIKHYITKLPHIGSPLPKTWVRVREQLEKDRRNTISLEEYLLICKTNGFTETKDGLQLSGYLHDIGVFLHFQDEPLLRKTIILKPMWGTDAVYKVLDNQTVIGNLGRFTRADLETIWDAPEYETMRDELLSLMMKFKLCYEIPNQKGSYIAPQLLTANQPDYEWDEKDNLLLRYSYEFMPKGILTQFIVVMSERIWKQTVWKSGVVLEKDRTRAEVIEYYGKREIRVRVAGAHRKELLTIIMHELDEIHSSFKRLKHGKLIPCNCAECKDSQEPYFHKYEQLQNLIEKRKTEIQCGKSGEMISARALIDDVLEKEYRNEARVSPVVQNIYYGDHIDQGEKKLAKINQTIKNSTIHGSVVAAESIKDSFNVIEKADIKDDLKEQLKQLAQAVEAMAKELPKEKAEEVAEDMKVLAEQATKEKPNPKWYNVSIEGLIAAAQNLGNVGDAVIELSGKVRKILTGGIL